MADDSVIAAVNLQIPDEATDFGFDDDTIETLLDSGLTQTKTILAVLNGMSAKAASVEDISESGSSRSSQFFNNLKALIDYWQIRADKEDISAAIIVKESAKSHTAKRV